MKKLKFSFFKYPNADLYRFVIAIKNEDGTYNQAINETLRDFITMWPEESDKDVFELYEQNVRGEYVPDNPDLPEMSTNDVCLWLCEPYAQKGMIAITNENTEYDSDNMPFQQFTLNQFKVALEAYRQFETRVKKEGIDALRDKVIEVEFPDK
jgi:hypothetical protein